MNTTQHIVIANVHEQVFRLALLVTGDLKSAARLVERSAAALTADEADVEQGLLRGLLPAHARYGRWHPEAQALARAHLDAAQTRTLLQVLGKRDAAMRLAIGLHYLRGLHPDEIVVVLGETPTAVVVQGLSSFRGELASALGTVSDDADLDTLMRIDRWLDGGLPEDQATKLRGEIFANPETRALRDGLIKVRTLLPQAIAGLFAVAAPADLLPRLTRQQAPRQKARRRSFTRPVAVGALVLGVIVLAALIIVVPGSFTRQAAPAGSLTAPEIIDAAIRRFERPPLTSGVLHESYTVEINGQQTQVVERWYDYAAPHRLAVQVRDAASGRQQLAIRFNGRDVIQYQSARPESSQSPNARTQSEYRLTEQEAQAALPALRSALMPVSIFGDPDDQVEISALYLAQARSNELTLLGRTNTAGREAWLLRYTTNQLPNDSEAERPRQVLLTIDAQLYAVLDVTVLDEGVSESIAYRPWRVDQIEVLDTVPEEQFVFRNVRRSDIDEPRSVLMPRAADGMFTSLREAQRESAQTLLMPSTVPDAMRGLVFSLRGSEMDRRYGLWYEGEFQTMLVLPGELFPEGQMSWSGEERTVGTFRYRLSEPLRQFRGGVVAQVYRPETPEERFNILLVDTFSTPEEREQRLQTVIESLAPVTPENVDMLERALVAVPSAGGAQQ